MTGFIINLLIEIQKIKKVSETVTNEHDKEILKEIYVHPEERQEIIDELRLKQCNNEISQKIKIFCISI